MSESENSLNTHRVFAIWSEDGTEVLDFELTEEEAKKKLAWYLENGEVGDGYHLATYDLSASRMESSTEEEDDPWDYDPEDLM